jgi:hypothetical protein
LPALTADADVEAAVANADHHLAGRLVGHDQRVDACARAEQLAREVLGAPRRDGADVELARILLRRGDDFLQRLVLRVGAGHDHQAEVADRRDHGEVVDRVVGQRFEQRLAHRVAVGQQQQRVAVGLGARHRLRRADAARPGHVLHQHLLAQAVGHLRRDGARGDVGDAARPERQHDAYRLGRK